MSTIEINHTDTDDQALLPIRSVSQVTGVNPITLRAWERRYDLIRPTRTPAGHRLYSQQDIRTIQRIQELAESGMGFAQIALVLDQESQQDAPKSREEPTTPTANAPAQSLLDRITRAAMDLDPTELREAEATALMWLPPEDYLRDVLIEALARLEARTGWPDRDLGLTWLSEYVKGRADWVADAPGHGAAPVVVVDNLVPGRAFSAGGLRLFAALHDDRFRVRLLPTGLSDSQREQMVRRWNAKAWVRLGPGDSPRPAPQRAGARVFWCDLPLLEPRDSDEAVNFMQRWRQVIDDDIQLCRDQVCAALNLTDSSHRPARQ